MSSTVKVKVFLKNDVFYYGIEKKNHFSQFAAIFTGLHFLYIYKKFVVFFGQSW
jgi:hypothetical protein